MEDITTESIAILGAGAVGRALASRLRDVGLDVRVGVREPATAVPIDDVPLLTPIDAARGATIVLLAVPAHAATDALIAASPADGTIVVDCTNPVRWDGGPIWNPPPDGSVAQALARACPNVRVVKAFNHFGAEVHAHPTLGSGPADAWVAGDDVDAKAAVLRLAERLGFRGGDAGPLRNAGLLENLAVLWIHLATSGAGRRFAFRTDRQAS